MLSTRLLKSSPMHLTGTLQQRATRLVFFAAGLGMAAWAPLVPYAKSRLGLDEATLGTRPNMAHVTAREEVTNLLRDLRLPLDERGRRRAANRAEWFAHIDKPLETHDLIA